MVSVASAVAVVWVVWRMHAYAARRRGAAATAHARQRYCSDGALVFVNGAFCRTIGKERDEVLGTPWTRYPVREDVALIHAQNARLTPANPIVTVECRFLRPDGHRGLSLEVVDSEEVARSDPTLLSVILRNLLGNAIKYTREGGCDCECVATASASRST